MIPGETIIGLDFRDHLWVVLSEETPQGMVALANFTTHGRSPACGAHCVLVEPGEHPYFSRTSCVYARGAMLNPMAPLREHKERGSLRQHYPLGDELLLRIQRAVVASRFTRTDVQQVIAATLGTVD